MLLLAYIPLCCPDGIWSVFMLVSLIVGMYWMHPKETSGCLLKVLFAAVVFSGSVVLFCFFEKAPVTTVIVGVALYFFCDYWLKKTADR